MSVLPPGAKLGRFEISSVLGQGAMGVVYLAHDPEIDRPVAIKMIHPEAARGESAAEVPGRPFPLRDGHGDPELHPQQET